MLSNKLKIESCRPEKRHPGNVADVMSLGIFLIAVMMIIVTFFQCTELIWKKQQINQISREYILRMETEGYLNPEEKGKLLGRVSMLGATSVDLTGTTMAPAGYGNRIVLCMKGLLLDKYEFEEALESTAKY